MAAIPRTGTRLRQQQHRQSKAAEALGRAQPFIGAARGNLSQYSGDGHQPNTLQEMATNQTHYRHERIYMEFLQLPVPL